MTGRKGIKEVQTKGTSAGGGFSVFQLFIFLIATSSMAMNFAMLYIFRNMCLDARKEKLFSGV